VCIEIIRYEPKYQGIWDKLCAEAPNATFLHARSFLGYHRDKFKDESLLFYKGGKLIGLLPAAQSLINPKMVSSHPGITYGGILHQGGMTGALMLEAFFALIQHYKSKGYSFFLYKAIPFIYPIKPSQDDIYALFRLGATIKRCDLSCALDLSMPKSLSNRRLRGIKKASRSVVISNARSLLPNLYGVIQENLDRKHGALPVHSLLELAELAEKFPKEIQLRCAIFENKVEAGVIFFISKNVWHAQYIAASEVAYKLSALDAVFDASIDEAKALGARYFDFGTSNEAQGTILNEGLYTFKSEFGGSGVAHEYYELNLLDI
jgi:hypothetical protein